MTLVASSTEAMARRALGRQDKEGRESPAGRPALSYRPDIDGLRAVAVLGVLAFHLGLTRFAGGFVGVDVFFVISGYLISSIVFSEIAASRFSLTGFYERRIRRIFPALFAMLALFSVFAVICLLPGELIDYAKSLLAATTSASNFYFWRHSGYFDVPMSHPLLHTWSLAVEEQFYITFPLFLALIRKLFPERLRLSVVILFSASLLASAIVVSRNPSTAFYMPYTRAWELLLGTILSLGMFPRLQLPWLRNLATLAGVAMIAFSVLFFSSSTLFPGLNALLPCVGSALIIGAGEAGSSLVGALLSWRPLVFIGLISYSLYLWHWPVIVLQHMDVLIGASALTSHHHWPFITPRRFDIVFEVVLSFFLAVLSWRFVELPFRNGRLRLGGRPLFALAGAVILVLVALSSWTVLAGGFPGRFSVDAVQVASRLSESDEYQSRRTGTCFIEPDLPDLHFENYNYRACLSQDVRKKNYLVLGDSHSAMLWSALSSLLPDANVMQASSSACAPVLHPSGSADCKKMMTYIFQAYLPAHPVQGLLLIARWSPQDLEQLGATIEWARQHQVPVTLFGPVPEYDGPLPRLLAYSIAWNEPGLASQHRVPNPQMMDVQLQRLAADPWHVTYISLYRAICGDAGCVEYADAARRVPLMIDKDHLSNPGAAFVVKRLIENGAL
jgi:peptidoglycan/LPS O-acetylase OafA/YrhL